MSGTELTLGISYFGKLPSKGDFVKATENLPLMTTLDRWVGQAIELLANDVAWKQLYDAAAPVHFAFMGSRSKAVIAGHLLPSQDATGRRFPFITAVSLEVAQPLRFIARSPLAFSRLHNRLERESQQARVAGDPGETLLGLAQQRVGIHTTPEALDPAFQDFLEMQTLGSFEGLIAASGHQVSVRRILIALGSLLQPVMASESSRLGKGLTLPLPHDPLYRSLVASFWLDLVSGFLGRADFELLTMISQTRQPTLTIGFSGALGRTLQAAFDPRVAEQDNIALSDPDWAEDHADEDYALKKLSTYTSQEGLSLRTARDTFRETFLGA
jgi:type VI secretion system protein ImpM